MISSLKHACLALVGVLTAMPLAQADDWPRFRGPAGDGVLRELRHPTQWSETKNMAWKTKLPGAGWSSPVVIGERIFVSSAASESAEAPRNMTSGVQHPSSFGMGGKKPDAPFRFELHCLDLRTGKILWSTLIAEATPEIPVHVSNTFATETPAADEQRVCVCFGTIGLLACLDHDGKLQWERRLPVQPVSAGLGPGSSPILHGEHVFLQNYNEKASTLAAYRLADGEPAWSIERPSKTSWATPIIWRHSREELIACGSGMVIAHAPQTGEELWRLGGISSSFSASPTATPEGLYFGSSGPMSDSPLYAVRPGASGDITPPRGKSESAGVLWSRKRTDMGMSSPVLYDGLLYVPSDGRLRVFDAATGEPVYRERLPEARIIVASPWAGDGKIFLLDEDGRTFVVKAGRTFEVLGVNRVPDLFWSSPAVAGDSLLLRGVEALYCIRETEG